MVRKVFAVLFGLIAGSFTVWAVEKAGHRFYPPAATVDVNDPESMRRMVAEMPAWAFVWVLLAWAAGALVGGFIAAKLAPSSKMRYAWIVGGLQLLAGVATILMIPGHPVWFILTGLALFLPAAWLGGRVAVRSAAESSESTPPPAPPGG
jgi:hypothetical protein